MFAIRGATSVAENTPEAIEAATGTLVRELLRRNDLTTTSVVSAYFTSTPDLDAAFPATGARRAGFEAVPMMCGQEIDVPGAPGRIVRVMLHVDGKSVRPVRHVYLGAAARLRPDLAEPEGDR